MAREIFNVLFFIFVLGDVDVKCFMCCRIVVYCDLFLIRFLFFIGLMNILSVLLICGSYFDFFIRVGCNTLILS